MKLNTLILGVLCQRACVRRTRRNHHLATVNNGDMIRMQKLTDDFTAKNPDIQL